MGKKFGRLSPCEGHTSTRPLGTPISQSARTTRLSFSSSASRPHPVIWLPPCRMTLSGKPPPFFFCSDSETLQMTETDSNLGSQNCRTDGGEGLPLNSRRCILYVYSRNIRTEYFKHAAHSPFLFSLQNAVYFITLHFWFLYYSHFTYRVC